MSPQWIVIGVLIALVYFIFIKKKPLSSERKTKKNDTLSGDDMVECKKCGTYITLDDALLKEGHYFCSNECLKA
ncbi:hypothetical protein JHD50_02645 [Sulfurimonas sp. MAG313]|nr:PP0621 family protein [Sulfurimonas sp. MAG313]MDF1880211.1 hypothetical protein [Sulfurimonas sp. MAG313]